MLISPEKVKEFQDLYKECFHEEISEEEAHEQAMRLIELVRTTYRPITEGEQEAYSLHNKEHENKS